MGNGVAVPVKGGVTVDLSLQSLSLHLYTSTMSQHSCSLNAVKVSFTTKALEFEGEIIQEHTAPPMLSLKSTDNIPDDADNVPDVWQLLTSRELASFNDAAWKRFFPDDDFETDANKEIHDGRRNLCFEMNFCRCRSAMLRFLSLVFEFSEINFSSPVSMCMLDADIVATTRREREINLDVMNADFLTTEPLQN